MTDSQSRMLAISLDPKLSRENLPASWSTTDHVDNRHIEVCQVESLPQPEKQPLLPARVRKRKTKQEESFIAAICALLVEHQIGKTKSMFSTGCYY